VNFSRKIASITYQKEVLKLSELAALLASIGYTPDVSVSGIKKSHQKKINRKSETASD